MSVADPVDIKDPMSTQILLRAPSQIAGGASNRCGGRPAAGSRRGGQSLTLARPRVCGGGSRQARRWAVSISALRQAQCTSPVASPPAALRAERQAQYVDCEGDGLLALRVVPGQPGAGSPPWAARERGNRSSLSPGRASACPAINFGSRYPRARHQRIAFQSQVFRRRGEISPRYAPHP